MKVFFILAMLCRGAFAADDLINCRWENGISMSEAVCEDQRSMQADQRKVEEAAEQRKACAKITRRELIGLEKSAVISAVKTELKDPYSAQFKWMKVVKQKSSIQDYCALVNAKNSYGGYVGYTPFQVMIAKESNGNITAIGPIIGNEDTMDMVLEHCASRCYEDFSSAK